MTWRAPTGSCSVAFDLAFVAERRSFATIAHSRCYEPNDAVSIAVLKFRSEADPAAYRPSECATSCPELAVRPIGQCSSWSGREDQCASVKRHEIASPCTGTKLLLPLTSAKQSRVEKSRSCSAELACIAAKARCARLVLRGSFRLRPSESCCHTIEGRSVRDSLAGTRM